MSKLIWPLVLVASLAGAAEPEQYGVFYCIYESNECVETPKPMSTARAARLFDRVAKGKSNFLGLTDEAGVILQLYVDAPDRIWVEIPAPERKGSFGKHMTEKEASALLHGLSGELGAQKKKLGLEFKAW